MQDRNRLRNHIRAAREWLGQADRSLEREEDVRGDLKIMLARAELQRAKESVPQSVWKRWGLRFMPVAVAVLLAWGGLQAYSAVNVAEEETPAIGAVPYPSAVVPQEKPADAESERNRVAEPIPSVPLPMQEPHGEEYEPEKAESQAPAPGAAASQEKSDPQPHEVEKATRPVPQVPSEDMQKLMQSAGKVLRAE